MKKFLMILCLGIVLYSLAGCKNNPKTPAITPTADWKEIIIDSVEVLHFPDYLEQKEYQHQFVVDAALSQQINQNIHTDTVSLNIDAYQYKIYLFSKGEPFKTLYVSTKHGEEFLSYVVNGKRIYHPLSEQIKLALQEFTGV
jgi:hypothetical protein